ncbi:uncharacterized protein LOC124945531 [Impatiens glandulifera]|uniref:uncharacterized protein LOC124945531 n=1 Tax=Impatiens glandulifera TaxID=253017 RepID=UPI001FB0571A|nr:uncharacterized protein LOC124945531 [Impatiens glandulifera]
MRGVGRSSPRSFSGESTPTSGDGHSSVDLSSESMEKYCRPMYDVFLETKVKGTLIERLNHVEDQLLKLCGQMEEEMQAEGRVGCGGSSSWRRKEKKKGGLKGLVKSVMKVGH